MPRESVVDEVFDDDDVVVVEVGRPLVELGLHDGRVFLVPLEQQLHGVGRRVEPVAEEGAADAEVVEVDIRP